MIIGLDLLACAAYPSVALNVPIDIPIRGFDNTFGEFLPVARKRLESGADYIGSNLLWSDTHSFGDSDIKKLKEIVPKYENLAKAFPNAIVEIAPFTEHNLKNPDKYLDIVQELAPSCRVANSVWKGDFSKRYKNEIHGAHTPKPKTPYNFSFDGLSCVDTDIEMYKERHAEADFFFLWIPRFNLKWSMKDGANRVIRLKEKKERRPSKDLVESIQYLMRKKGNTNIPNKWLIKSHAERHNFEDKKGDKLLIISPIKTTKIELHRNGVIVASLPYYGTYSEGGFRYYSNSLGYKFGSGLDVFAAGEYHGEINGGFRDGWFINK